MSGQVSDRNEIARQIKDIVAAEGKIDIAKLTPDATFESLEVQSIDVVMILMALEEKFGVYIPISGEIAEAKDLSSFVESVTARILEDRAQSAA